MRALVNGVSINPIVLVTGGSRGIGAATSKYLAKQNYIVCVNYNSNENVTSYFLCCREAVNRMESGGAIVNVSSAASRLGSPSEYLDYAVFKGAIDTLTIGLSLEVASKNIRVNCVRSEFIYTEMHSDGGEPV